MDYVHDCVLGSLTLKQVTQSNYQPGNNMRAGRTSSGVDPSAFFVVGAQAQATFASADIAGVLGGLSVTAGLLLGSADVFQMPFNKAENGGTFDADGAFVLSKSTGASGASALVIPQSIAASNQDDAIANLITYLLSNDGFTHPISSQVSQTPAAQAFNASFGFGGVAIDGAMTDWITGATVNPGIEIQYHPNGGKNYPQKISIRRRNPTIDLEFADMDAMNAHGPNFGALTSATVYFRKRVDGGTYVDTATTDHVGLSFANGLKDVQSIGAAANQPGAPGLRLHGKALTSSTGTAIPVYS